MIVKNIEILCKNTGISISALEKTLGFGNSTISKWSRCSPTVEKLVAIADYFGVTIDELITKEAQP